MDRLACRAWCAALWMAAVLTGCGGGGGGGDAGGDPAVRDPLPTLVQDLLPVGERLDLRDRHYLPAQAGDSWTYDVQRNGSTSVRGATVVVTSASGDDAWLTETVLGTASSGHWRRTAAGIVSVGLLDGVAPAAAAALVGDVLEYPEPFYPVGSARQVIRQGSWGADLDGDGRSESFRLEVTQVLVGFETVSLPLGSAEAAHMRTVVRLTVTPSLVANAPVTAVSTEDSWWAPGVGRVRADYSAFDGDGNLVAPASSLTIVEAMVGGVQQFQAQPDGSVQKLALLHNALVFDRGRALYYASIPASATSNGNSIATIDAASAALRYATPIGSNPAALAIAADGASLYVALNGSGEVLRLALPSLQELSRTRLPAPAPWGQLLTENLAASPADAEVVAVAMLRAGVSPRHGGVALIRSGVLQPQMTQEHTGSNLIAFAADGQWLYGYNNESSEFGLRRIEVLADGLAERSVVGTSGGFGLAVLDVSAQGPVLGDAQYRGSDLALLGRVSAPGGGCRVPVAAGRLLCLQEAAYVGGTAGHVVVADATSFVTLATPAYAVRDLPSDRTELVPGSAGQVALRLGLTNFGVPAQAVWLFNSPQLP